MSQCHSPMTTSCKRYPTLHARSTAPRLKRMQARLNLVSINIFREAHFLDVNELDMPTQDWYIRFTITDVYEQCRQRMPPSMACYKGKIYHTDDSNQDLHWDMSSERSTGGLVGCCINSEVGISRNWGPRIGSRGNGSIELQNLGPEEVINWAFLSSVFSLLFSIPYYLIASQRGTNAMSRGFYHLRIAVKWRWSFPIGWIHWQATGRCQSVVGLISLYEYIHGMTV